MQQAGATVESLRRRDRGDGERPPHPLLPLTIRSLGYRAGDQWILKDVSFRLPDATRTVILGPNGAGKSVLLRLCHGLLQPSAGTISWGGLTPESAASGQALVAQRPVLLRRSVAGNILHALKIRHVPRSQRAERVRATLALAGLEHLKDRPARTLSGGEQQRVTLARAWALRPNVLMLDEPTSSLDPGATRGVEELIRAVDAAGTKIIMTTHDISQGRRLADDVLFLHQGRLVEHAPAAEFFAAPSAPAAAQFIRGELPF